jgi:hypothetical protein
MAHRVISLLRGNSVASGVEADINHTDGRPLPRFAGRLSALARVSRTRLFGPGATTLQAPLRQRPNDRSRYGWFARWSRRSERTKIYDKLLILLALPRGLEPLFSP